MSIYVITDGKHIKIGISDDPDRRIKQLQTGNPLPLKKLYSFSGWLDEEKQLHDRLSKHKTGGGKEWFHWNPDVKRIVEDYIKYGEYSGEGCPRCKGFLVERSGEYGKFMGCSCYPECKYSEKIDEAGLLDAQIKKRVERSKCSKCEKGYMVKKSGKYGEFIGCSYYPYCKNTKRKS